jgi:CheY-like chemotaxis protein
MEDATSARLLRSSRILVVEDQEDVRRMLVTALQMEGHAVDEACDANEGLLRLTDRHYQLVLSDYAMPGGTGTWMLGEAKKRGLMEDSVALIVTAHPNVRELADVEVIGKPLDLDYFLEQVRRVLEDAPDSHHAASPATENVEGTPVHKVELVLYVSSASPSSLLARRNLEKLLERFDSNEIHVTICDLVSDPLAGEEDRIAFTPTLVKKSPGPKIWVLGNLRDPQIVEDLLGGCGVSAS